MRRTPPGSPSEEAAKLAGGLALLSLLAAGERVNGRVSHRPGGHWLVIFRDRRTEEIEGYL